MWIFVPQSTDVLDLYGLLISTATHYLQLLSSNNKKTTGGRDLINFENTRRKTKAQNNNQPSTVLSLPPSAIPGCLPAADNGCAPQRALYWDDE